MKILRIITLGEYKMKIHCSLQLNSAYVKNFDALGGRLCIFVALFGGDTWQTFGHLLAQLVAGCKVRKSTEKPGRRWKKVCATSSC